MAEKFDKSKLYRHSYLVGGAVRDILLGHEAKDKDYVIFGLSEDQVMSTGIFDKAGNHFPIFINREDGCEYALARTERKTGEGYNGFDTYTSKDVTIHDDLYRRDLTINAIAKERTAENYYDPYNGFQDIEDKVFRHVSDSFWEDPVRVLRVARFRARFGPEWTVAQETKDLMRMMGKKGVLNELTAERVWKELSRALMENYPRLFFDTLLETDTLKVLFPEVYYLKAALESYKWHPEGDAYEHSMLVLMQSAYHDMDLTSRLSCLVHDFGKGITPKEEMPNHFKHDVKGVKVVDDFCHRLTVPAKMREHAKKATRYHMTCHRLNESNPKTIVKMFDAMKVLNDPESVDVLYNVGICDERGRLGSEQNDYNHVMMLKKMFYAYKSVKFNDVVGDVNASVDKIKQKLYNARTKAVKKVMSEA